MYVNVDKIENLRKVEEVFKTWREDLIEKTISNSDNKAFNRDSGIYMSMPKLENQTVIRLVEEVDEATKVAVAMVDNFLWMLLFILVCCFGALIYNRIEQKKSEFGLLRMMGGSHLTLQKITFFQVIIIGFPSIIIGILFGLFGFSIFLKIKNIPFSFVFNHEFFMRLGFAAFTCIFFMILAAWFACRISSNKSPSELINSH